MNQTKLSSFIEVLVNTVIGYLINYFANIIIFPLFNLHISLSANILMGLIYTVISVVRSYVIRRWFSTNLHDIAASLAAWWIKKKAQFSHG